MTRPLPPTGQAAVVGLAVLADIVLGRVVACRAGGGGMTAMLLLPGLALGRVSVRWVGVVV